MRSLLPRCIGSLFAVAPALLSADARAVVPRIVGDPIVDNPSFDGVVNTMMYTVTVTVDGTGSDADHTAMVGFASEADYGGCNATPWRWSQPKTFDTTDTRTWTLYNFIPGTTYYYRVRIGSGATARSRCGVLETVAVPTPTLPAALGYLNIRYAKAGPTNPFDTKYVLVESDDCGGGGGGGATNYLIVIDAVNEAIVWYLDVAAAAGLAAGSGSGFRYYRGATGTFDSILMHVSHRYLYEWGFDGTTRNSHDLGNGPCAGSGATGPCFHHDVNKSSATGNTYALTAFLSPTDTTGTVWEDICTDAQFVDDGFHVFDDSFAVADETYIMEDAGYDPAVDPGPNGVRDAARPNACSGDSWNRLFDAPDGAIDWLHANSIAPATVGGNEVVDVSLKIWDQVLRFDAATGELLWRLAPRLGDSDWGTISMAAGIVGEVGFSDQHDVHSIGPNTLLMLDNQGDSEGARALQIRLNTRPRSAVIEKSWAVVSGAGNPLGCATEGTAEMVPNSDNVLAMCAGVTVAVELDDPTGNSGNPPPLAISLPDGDPEEFCAVGGPPERNMISGWRRAFPMERVGEF
jgi:hypothetical protein